MEKCPICEASVGRNQFSDYWRCDNGHTIYRGNEGKSQRFELRLISVEEQREQGDGDGAWAVWDKLQDEPFYDSVGDDYAYLITESRARSILSRLI